MILTKALEQYRNCIQKTYEDYDDDVVVDVDDDTNDNSDDNNNNDDDDDDYLELASELVWCM